MKFKKSTRYALYAAMEMAKAGAGKQITAAQVAERYAIPGTVLAKVLQELVRAGVAVGTRGSGGGYGLARPAAETSVLDVIDAFEEPVRRQEECLIAGGADCAELGMCRLRKLVDEVDELARATYASVSLETLVGQRPPQSVELRVVR